MAIVVPIRAIEWLSGAVSGAAFCGLRVAQKSRFPCATRDKAQGYAVVAPALPGGRRPVIKNMAVVAAAADAVIFGARQN